MARASFIVVAALALSIVCGWALIHYAGLQTSLLWTAIIGAITLAIKSNIEKKQEHQRLLAESKRNHYLQFLEFMSRSIGPIAESANEPSESQSPEFISELRMWSLRLTLIGSDDVVHAWNLARQNSAIHLQSSNTIGVLHNWGKLWLAMRKDSGHLDTKLEISDVLASFVNDIEGIEPR